MDHVSTQGKHGRPPAVLCPGCGLARLPFDLVRLGYAAQGNEFLGKIRSRRLLGWELGS